MPKGGYAYEKQKRKIGDYATAAAGVLLEKENNIIAKGPIGKFFSETSLIEIISQTKAKIGDTIFLSFR